ncbi:MAG: 50S ribosomal protein L25 [Patescibacteria group bacterium]
MSDSISLTLTKRTATGKKVAGLRKEGQTPGVVYGHGFNAINVQAPEVAIQKVVAKAGKHHMIDLIIDGDKKLGLIKDIEIDPVRHKLNHVSFHAVRAGDKVETSIPVKLTGIGESAAERAGLVILQTLENLTVRALPKDLPDSLEVSIVDLEEPGQGVTIADLKIPSGVELNEENQDITIASVYEPSALAAANEAAGGDAEDESEVESENGEAGESEGSAEEKPEGEQEEIKE